MGRKYIDTEWAWEQDREKTLWWQDCWVGTEFFISPIQSSFLCVFVCVCLSHCLSHWLNVLPLCVCFPKLCIDPVAFLGGEGSSVLAFTLYVNVFPGDLPQSISGQERDTEKPKKLWASVCMLLAGGLHSRIIYLVRNFLERFLALGP